MHPLLVDSCWNLTESQVSIPVAHFSAFHICHNSQTDFNCDTGPDAHLARSKLQDSLHTNDTYKELTDGGLISNPTIRVVAPGTFSTYRELKANAVGSTSGQTKLPCSISDPEWTKWLLTKVVQEL